MRTVQTKWARMCLFIGIAAGAASLMQACGDMKTKPNRVPGTVICHYPRQDSIYLGSPSICILPDGSYVASNDEFGPKSHYLDSAFTVVYRSEDRGASWHPVVRMQGQLWSNLFWHADALYLLGTVCEHGALVIRRSRDGGRTWSVPRDGKSGRLREGQYHTAPMPIVYEGGRVWRAIEHAQSPPQEWGKRYRAMLISAPVDADLLSAGSWTETNALPYDSTYLEGTFGAWLEGNAVVGPGGELVDVLRVDHAPGPEYAAIVRWDAVADSIRFDPQRDFIPMPGGAKKFSIRYDSVSGKYIALVNYVRPAYVGANPAWVRNVQALASSEDLRHWTVNRIVLEHPDIGVHGFQYTDWQFDGHDLIFVSRTAYDEPGGGAHNLHDANYMTFHRIPHFRRYLQQAVVE